MHHSLSLVIIISEVILALAFVGTLIFHEPLPSKKGSV